MAVQHPRGSHSGGSAGPLEFSVDQKALQALKRALDEEADGKKLRRDLSKGLRQAMEPVKSAAMHNVQALHSSTPIHANSTGRGRKKVTVADAGASLRQAIAGAVKAEGRLTGKSTGARLRVPTKGMPRGFATAARRLNRKSGWRHPVFGMAVWVQQFAQPAGWFDRATSDSRTLRESKAAVLEAMEDMAKRIKNRVES